MVHTRITALHEGRTDATPEQVGMDRSRLEQLDPFFAGLIEQGKLQGASYLVARDGQIVVHKAQGKLTPHEDGPDLMPDSIRKVYSITKAFTATAVTRLCEDGLIYPTQPVCSILPEFDTNLHRDINIWNLVTHTSGLYPDPGVHEEAYPLPWYGWAIHEVKKQMPEWGDSDWIRMLLAGRPVCKPGTEWNYSTAGFVLLGEVISRVSGMPYEEYIRQTITGPLGMLRTAMNVPEDLRTEACFTTSWEEENIFRPSRNPGTPVPAGNGLFSTLDDLYRFGQAMLDGGRWGTQEILGRRSVRMMLSDHLKDVKNRCWGADNSDYRFAFGWGLGGADLCSPATFSHEGYGHCRLYADPEERLVFVYFVPSKAGWVPESVINPRNIVWSALG